MLFKERSIVFTLGFCSWICLWMQLEIVTPEALGFGFRFVTWPSWHIVSGGEEVILSCSTNLPPDSIRWQHNNRYFEAHSGHNVFADVEANQALMNVEQRAMETNLTIKISKNNYIRSLQEGFYQCVASVGSISVTSLPGRILLSYLNPYAREFRIKRFLEIEEGYSFRIPCERPDSIPEASLQFFQNGVLLDLTDENQFHVTEGGDLIVLTASSSSKGEYFCRAYNSLVQTYLNYSVETNVSLKMTSKKDILGSPPRLTTFDSVIYAGLGDRVRFLCISHENRAHLSWSLRRSNVTLAETSKSHSISLVIQEVDAMDEGVYRCHGNNSFGYSFVDITLYVTKAPYVITGLKSQTIAEESTISLQCIFGGCPSPKILWVFNGKPFMDSKSVTLTEENKINIRLMEKNQAGLYQCFAVNDFGSSQDIAVITVIPKTIAASSLSPGKISLEREIDELLESEKKTTYIKNKEKKNKKKIRTQKTKLKSKMISPTHPNVTKLSDESVMVTWDIASGNGIPILFFKVQYRILDDHHDEFAHREWNTIDEDIPSHVKSFEVTGLKPNHLYRFRVLAAYVNNDNQPGVSSKKFFLEKEIKLKSPERAPEILVLFPVDDRSLILFWDYRASTKTEGFIIYYRESTSAADYTKVTLLGSDRRNYTITHLIPNYPYDFKMVSFNMAGTSNFSQRKMFQPEGFNFTTEEYNNRKTLSSPVPIVKSDPEINISSRILCITLGTGLGILLLIVILSYIIYSCRKKNSENDEKSNDGKFIDASLRVHRHSTMDMRQPSKNDCQFNKSGENVTLLPRQGIPTSNENQLALG